MSGERLRSYPGELGPLLPRGATCSGSLPSLPITVRPAPCHPLHPGSLSFLSGLLRDRTNAWSESPSGSGPAVSLDSSSLSFRATSALANPCFQGARSVPFSSLRLTETQARNLSDGHGRASSLTLPTRHLLYTLPHGAFTEVCQGKTERCRQVSEARPLVGACV